MIQTANVGALERIVSVTAGTLLMVPIMKKRSVTSAAGAVCGADLIWRGVTGRCRIYEALDIDTAVGTKPGSQVRPTAPHVTRSITIAKPAEELYAFWREPENISRIMPEFVKVTPRNDGVTHWRLCGPANEAFEWDSQQNEDEPGRILSWQSLPGTELPNHGALRVRPAPQGIGSEVTLEMQFEPPLGNLGAQIAKLLHKVPRAIAGQALRRFKSLLETGEIPSLQDNPSGRGGSDPF